MDNIELKNLLRKNHVAYWQIGEAMEISENTVYRLLRKPLTKDMEEKMLCAFNSIISARENNS